MLSTGNQNIDIYLEGGIPNNSNILLMSEPGIEKTILSLQYLWEGIKNNEKCIYVTTDKDPEYILRIAEKYGWSLKQFLGNQLFFVDCYSWTLGNQQSKTKLPGVKQVFGTSALNDISIELSKLIEPTGVKRIVFHSLSTFLLNNSPDTIFRFIQITGARLKSLDCSTLFLLDNGMHDLKIVSTIEHLVDEVIFMEKKQDNWKLKLKSSSYFKPLDIEFGAFGVRAL